MPVAAVIGGIASVAGGAIAAHGAKSAAKTQAKAADKATATQMKMFETTREDLAPYSQVGKGALYTLADLYGIETPGREPTMPMGENALEAFRRSPDYQVARTEGITALDRSAAARGMLLSGGQVKALADYGADLGNKNFQNYANRLTQLMDTGRGAASQTGAFSANAARGIADTQLAAGEANAAGTVGAFNNIAGGLTDGFNSLATFNRYQNINPSSYTGIQYGRNLGY